ncbi:MAG: O-antigen ligase family protein, partial [Gammaproteobacteria bacterium]|nr:O-antigen ligase family protein [Gammaproteobacteria bacterium]
MANELQRIAVKKKQTDSSFAFFLFALYIAFVFIRPHEIWNEYSELSIIKFIMIFCILSVLLFHRPIKFYPQFWMFVLLIPLIMISAYLNGYGSKGIEHSEQIILSLILPFFLASNTLTSLKRQNIIIWIMIIASLLMIHNGHVQFNSIDGYGWAGNSHLVSGNDRGVLGRITYVGFFSDPNDLGLLIVMNLPFLMLYFYWGGIFKKILMILIFIIFLYGIYLTGSRGTMLGAACVVIAYYLINNAGKKLFLFTVLLAPIIATIIASYAGVGSSDESASGRLEAWYDGIYMLIANPAFGIGMGNFHGLHGRTAHNSYILIAAELGVPGYTLWGGALFFTILPGYFIVKAQQLDKVRGIEEKSIKDEILMNKAILFSMIGFLITAFFLSRTYTVVAFCFMGIAYASYVRIVRLIPEYKVFVNSDVLIKSMLY